MKNKLKFFLQYYLPIFLWVGGIFYLSGIPSLEYGGISTINEIILRKGAHFFEYAVLSILLFRLFYKGIHFGVRHAFWWAFFLSFLYGASDEFHQTFVAGRTGKAIDVFFDAGSSLFILELLVVRARRRISWKNILILCLSLAILFSLEFKMISEAKEAKISWEKMKKEFYITVKNNFDYIKNGKIKEEKREKIEKKQKENLEDDKKIEISEELSGKANETEKIEEDEAIEFSNIPEKIFVKVSFTSQAPFAVWDETHEEACEEASLVMVKYYLDGKTLNKETAEKEIQDLVDYQMEKFGDYRDTDAATTARIGEDFYGIKNLKVVYDFSKNDLKRYLALGRPIIIPAAGRALGNPNFTPPGPLYHNLVLVGYDGGKIITNDPGTRRGESYVYDMDVLYQAIHDFPGDVSQIEKGRKAMIIVE